MTVPAFLASIAIFLSPLISFSATISCIDTKVRNSPVVLQFDYQDTGSARFAGNLKVMGQNIPNFQVAQYKATAEGFFVVVDDAQTFSKPVYAFESKAVSTRKAFAGASVSNLPGVPKKQSLSCRLH